MTCLPGVRAEDEASEAKQIAKLLANDAAANDIFGRYVSVSGSTIVVGAYGNDEGGRDSGSAYVFEKSDDGKYVQAAKLVADDAAAKDTFGRPVSVSGSTIVVGAGNDDDDGKDSGSAYVFEKSDDGKYVQAAKLVADDAAEGDNFGAFVSVSGSTIVVSARNNDDDGKDSGSAYVFEKSDDGKYVQAAKLVADDAAAMDRFGEFVSVSGSTIVVSARNNDDDGSNSGSVYVFEKSDDGKYVQAAKLVADDAAAKDYFGFSVSVSGSTIVVGALGNDDGGPDSGSAYVFEKSDNGKYVQAAKLVANDAAAKDWFSYSVSVSGSTIVVGAPNDDDGSPQSGSAYVFKKIHGKYVQAAKLVADDAAVNDYFGRHVSVSGSTIVVGAYGNDDDGRDSGSAYVFDIGSGDDSDNSATFYNVFDSVRFETTVTKSSDGTYIVTAKQENAMASDAFLSAKLGAAASMSSPALAVAPILALAAAAGVAMNRSRRVSRASDEDAPLLKGAQYGAASV